MIFNHATVDPAKMTDITAKVGVQIQVQRDGLVTWINVDGFCVLRIFKNGFVPIEIEDNREVL